MLGDLPVYRYGSASNAKWVLWGHDIFGVLSGRTMEYCAKMNEDLGVTCILPDFFRGADPWVPGDPVPSTWAQMGLSSHNLTCSIFISLRKVPPSPSPSSS